MAMAGQASLDRLGTQTAHEAVVWRRAIQHVYNGALFAAGAALVVFAPPRFDFSIQAVATVAIVALFLVIMERPQPAYQSSGHAPLAAILAAATATISWWSLPLAVVGWSAIHLRLRAGRPFGVFLSSYSGQLGMAVLAIYPMVAIFGLTSALNARIPHELTWLVTFIGIVAVGMAWQTVNNGLVVIGLVLAGKPTSFTRYWRAGLVASLWAYLLTAMYAFGGIFAAAVFYIAVASTRMIERIVQAVEARDEHDHLVSQFHEMARELIGLLNAEDSAFAGDVRYLSMQLARKLALPKIQVENIGWAAEFHEIGKCKLSEEVRGGANLTPGQQYERLRYPMLGGKVLRIAPRLIPEEVAYAVEHQCEAFDGTGYPHAMKGERIPVASRIIAIARDYLAMITGHGHDAPSSKAQALEILSQRAGSQYDPALVDLLCREIA